MQLPLFYYVYYNREKFEIFVSKYQCTNFVDSRVITHTHTHTHTRTRTHTHTHTHIYMCVCVCVCVEIPVRCLYIVWRWRWKQYDPSHCETQLANSTASQPTGILSSTNRRTWTLHWICYNLKVSYIFCFTSVWPTPTTLNLYSSLENFLFCGVNKWPKRLTKS